MHGSFVQADFIDRLAIKPRTLQFWTANDVLKTTTPGAKAGSGVHRRYSAGEVEIAAILAEVSRYGVSVGTLRGLASWIRDIQKWGKKFGAVSIDATEAYLREQKFKRERLTAEFKETYGKHSYKELRSLFQLKHLLDLPRGKPEITDDEYRQILTWLEYERARKPRWDEGEFISIYLAYGDDGEWAGHIQGGDNEELAYNRREGAKFARFDSYIVVRLSNIFAKLWSETTDEPEKASA
jgi:hypothetical protein